MDLDAVWDEDGEGHEAPEAELPAAVEMAPLVHFCGGVEEFAVRGGEFMVVGGPEAGEGVVGEDYEGEQEDEFPVEVLAVEVFGFVCGCAAVCLHFFFP